MTYKPTRRDMLRAGLATAGLSLTGMEGFENAMKDGDQKASITDVAGIKVGHYTDSRRPTGCTAILCEGGAVGGVDVRGAAPGTRETDLLNPVNTVQEVHAVVLSGGSAFGLDAATGVMRYLEERGVGFPVGVGRVPIVPAAILFDLTVGDAKIRPNAEAGYQAAKAATTNPPEQGNVGAGAGATVGKLFGMSRAMKGGIGTAAIKVAGITVGAIVAVNAVGDVFDPSNGKVIAGARTKDGKRLLNTMSALLNGEAPASLTEATASTIGLVATDAVLNKAQATKVAQMAHDGLARTINPIHTSLDGDTIFAIATGKSSRHANVTLIGALAAEVIARAVISAVRSAKGLQGLPS